MVDIEYEPEMINRNLKPVWKNTQKDSKKEQNPKQEEREKGGGEREREETNIKTKRNAAK